MMQQNGIITQRDRYLRFNLKINDIYIRKYEYK